jgi:hypothetical protein
MKTRFSIFIYCCAMALIPFLILGSCNEARKLTAFDVIYNLPKVTFSYAAKDLKITELTIYSGKLTIKFDSILNANQIPSGIIASAYLTRLAMVITAPPEATFNWLSAVSILGSADSTFQQTTLLGTATGIDPTTKNINLVLTNVDIRPILFKNSYYVEIVATPSGQVPASSINMYLDTQVKLHIEPL